MKERIDKFIKFMPEGLISDNLLSYLKNMNYFMAPSSMYKHSNYIGGNFDHSLMVTELLLKYTNKLGLKWERKESPYIVGMFHDLCKSDNYKFIKDEYGNLEVSYNECVEDKRHAEKSLAMIAPFLDLTVEEKLCIYYHMGAYSENENYCGLMYKMMKKYPNILWTQVADTEAAIIKDI